MHLDDAERLLALRTSGLLGKSMPERLSHLTFAAARLVMADVAQINALDEFTAYNISGWPPDAEYHLTRPVEDSGCRTVVMSGQALVVQDTLANPLTCERPWAGRMRGYLGVPVMFDHQAVGSLCVLTREPRAWKTYDITALEGIARLVSISLMDLAHH